MYMSNIALSNLSTLLQNYFRHVRKYVLYLITQRSNTSNILMQVLATQIAWGMYVAQQLDGAFYIVQVNLLK